MTISGTRPQRDTTLPALTAVTLVVLATWILPAAVVWWLSSLRLERYSELGGLALFGYAGLVFLAGALALVTLGVLWWRRPRRRTRPVTLAAQASAVPLLVLVVVAVQQVLTIA
jgi:high-affinity Fe2+/Pb2+ permease